MRRPQRGSRGEASAAPPPTSASTPSQGPPPPDSSPPSGRTHPAASYNAMFSSLTMCLPCS